MKSSQSQSKTFDLWAYEAQAKGRSCPYFSDIDFSHHLNVLGHSGIGKSLTSLAEQYKIEYINNEDLPENTAAVYNRRRGDKKRGTIEYKDKVHATLLGHELRHVWQHLAPEMNGIVPQSPEEQIMFDRFMEADGRAVEFMTTVQCIHHLRISNDYAQNLLACLDDYEKKILLYSEKELARQGEEPAALLQGGRNVFDAWISHSPAAPADYDNQTEESIGLSSASVWKRSFAKMFNKLQDPYPKYTRRGISPEFVESLVGALGTVDGFPNSKRNYLVETKGLPFTNEFYTRICSYRLERACERAVPKPSKPLQPDDLRP